MTCDSKSKDNLMYQGTLSQYCRRTCFVYACMSFGCFVKWYTSQLECKSSRHQDELGANLYVIGDYYRRSTALTTRTSRPKSD